VEGRTGKNERRRTDLRRRGGRGKGEGANTWKGRRLREESSSDRKPRRSLSLEAHDVERTNRKSNGARGGVGRHKKASAIEEFLNCLNYSCLLEIIIYLGEIQILYTKLGAREKKDDSLMSRRPVYLLKGSIIRLEVGQGQTKNRTGEDTRV